MALEHWKRGMAGTLELWHWKRRMAGTLETMALETEGTGTLKLLKEEGAGTAVYLCGRLSHNYSLEVFFAVQFTEHFLWQRRRCQSHEPLHQTKLITESALSLKQLHTLDAV